MIGAIVGDILGSIHEKIPGKELRKELQLTDDSFLTLATYSWMKSIDLFKFQFLFEKHRRFESAHYLDFENKLRLLAEKNLIQWHDIGHASKWQQLENSIPIFSQGFEAWVANTKQKINGKIKHKGSTNGCLMRNSPIAYVGAKNGLTLDQVLKLSEIFCLVTHPHFDSLNSVRIHSAMLYKIYKEKINAEELKIQLADSQRYFFNNHIELRPLDYWLPTQEKIEENPSAKFIWDAKTSLDIACSAIFYSNSFQQTMDFCNGTQMDTDTYAAIAGPIAEALWGIEETNLNIAKESIKQEPQAYDEVKELLKA